MLKKVILSIVLLQFFLSCSNKAKNKSLNTLLTNDSIKYWDIVLKKGLYSKSNNRIFPYYSYSFNASGNYFFYTKRDNYRVRFVGGDVVLPDAWSYINDSTIKMNNKTAKILKLDEDTFKYYDISIGSTVILSKSKDQSHRFDSIEEAPPLIKDITRCAGYAPR